MPITYLLTLLLFLSTVIQDSWATDEVSQPPIVTWDLKTRASVGFNHDSNVSIRELDSNLGESDSAKTYNLGITAIGKIGFIESSASYNFSQSDYQSFSEFDRKTEILGLDVSSSFLNVRQGLSYFKAEAKLGKKKFLKLERWSPHISGFLTKRLYLRGSYIAQEKTIIPRPSQSAKSNSVALDLFYFRNGLRNYFNLGTEIRNEDAVLQRYDNHAESMRFRMLGRVRALNRIWKYTIGWSYEKRDYEGDWPRTDQERFDRRRTIRAGLSWPISKFISAEIYASRIDSNSTVSYASFEEDTAGFKIVYTWD